MGCIQTGDKNTKKTYTHTQFSKIAQDPHLNIKKRIFQNPGKARNKSTYKNSRADKQTKGVLKISLNNHKEKEIFLLLRGRVKEG